MNAEMNADEIMRALKSNAEVNHHAAVMMMMAADLIETLQAQLAASQRMAQDARNELCLNCGRYHEAHNGSCDGCRWKENEHGQIDRTNQKRTRLSGERKAGRTRS